MKRIYFLYLMLVLLLPSCQSQKSIVKENVPMYLWKQMALRSMDDSYSDFRDDFIDYGEAVLDEYKSEHNKKMYEREQAASLFGTNWSSLARSIDAINALGGSYSNVSYDPYKKNVKQFNQRVESVLESIADSSSQKFYCKLREISAEDVINKTFNAQDCNPDIVLDSLVGTPKKLQPEIDEAFIGEIAYILVENACYSTEWPEISSMKYDKDTKYWTVMFYGTDAIVKAAVKKNKNDDGEPELDYKILGLD